MRVLALMQSLLSWQRWPAVVSAPRLFWPRELHSACTARMRAPAIKTPPGLLSNASLDGGLAVAVPGELHGLAELWRRHGSVPWAQLVRPAAELARDGFAAHPYLVYVLSGPGNRRKVEVRLAG